MMFSRLVVAVCVVLVGCAQVQEVREKPPSEPLTPRIMNDEVKFHTPKGYVTLFYYTSEGGSKLYNFMQVYTGSTLQGFFPILPTNGPIYHISKEEKPVEYTLRAYAQVPGKPDASRSQIELVETVPENPGDKAWIIRIRGNEGRDIQAAIVITVDSTRERVGGNILGQPK
ncbi:MAG: hypothetical protein Q8N00_12980 [Nitrospirota bacterium]|nr:hypothetical protein [Nitrospirota bacterium]MDP3597230.1 hypothetical protein [Nitrospirota bacterium]